VSNNNNKSFDIDLLDFNFLSTYNGNERTTHPRWKTFARTLKLVQEKIPAHQGLRGHKHLVENEDLRLWVQSPASTSNFSSQDWKNINKAPSIRVIIICSDHGLLWRDSYKGIDGALTLPESKLLKIINVSFFWKFKPRHDPFNNFST